MNGFGLAPLKIEGGLGGLQSELKGGPVTVGTTIIYRDKLYRVVDANDQNYAAAPLLDSVRVIEPSPSWWLLGKKARKKLDRMIAEAVENLLADGA